MGRNRVAPQKNDSFFKKSAHKTQKREGLFKRSHIQKPSTKKAFNDDDKFQVEDFSEKHLRKHPRPNQGRMGGDSFFVTPSSSDSRNPDYKVRNNELKPAKSGGSDKKPFDKKRWRLQKYSKKYKLEQWEDRRKKAVLRGYYKEIKDEDKVKKLDVAKIYEEHKDDDDDDDEEAENDSNVNANIKSEQLRVVQPQEKSENEGQEKKKVKPFKRAHLEFERLKEEKKRQKEEALKAKAEKIEAIKESKLKKQEKSKRLNKKTRKGQPIMKDRMEMLLEKIQQTVGPTTSS